jgi:integrase
VPLRLTKRPKTPNWVMRGTVRGLRIEESTGVSDKRLAEEIRAKREAELLAESIHGRAATATFAQAAVSYMENGGSRRFAAPVIRHFGTTPLVRINQEALDIGAKKLFPNAAPATRNRQFYSVAAAILNHAARRGWCSKPIIERPEQKPGRIRWLKIDEADALIEACNDCLRPLVIFMLYTGARVGEALWLDWRYVDLTRAHVTFPKSKNGEARGVPLHPRLIAALANIENKSGEIFRRPDGEPYSRPKSADDTSGGTRIKKAFAGACRRAGIVDFHPHDCRHTWATWHYAHNRDLIGLMRLGGWKSERMVIRYAHVNVGELAHTIDNLPGGNFGDPQTKKGNSL